MWQLFHSLAANLPKEASPGVLWMTAVKYAPLLTTAHLINQYFTCANLPKKAALGVLWMTAVKYTPVLTAPHLIIQIDS